MSNNSYQTFDQFKDSVRNANPLIDVAREYLEVQGHGSIKALCPFHSEKTPSFMLHPSGEFFKCFGCGKVCDVFELVMHFENISFKEALRYLAQRASISYPNLPEEDNEQYVKQKEIEKQEYNLFEAVLRIVKEAKIIESPSYIEKRGISYKTGDNYECISCNLETTLLGTKLRSLGFSDEVIEKSKVLHDSRFFASSLIIPIRMRGKIINFCSRTLKDRDPKYLYLAGHNKGVFNFDEALIQNEIFITEAPLDALALIDHGFTGAVSIGGCNPSTEQISILKKLVSKRNYLCFDNDADKEELL